MAKDNDLGSDAARSIPETAEQDREALKKRTEQNIERMSGRSKPVNREASTSGESEAGSEAAEPSHEKPSEKR